MYPAQGGFLHEKLSAWTQADCRLSTMPNLSRIYTNSDCRPEHSHRRMLRSFLLCRSLRLVEIPPGTEWWNSENGSGVTSADALAPVFQPLLTRQTFCTDENLRSVTLCVFHGCIPPRLHIRCTAYSKAVFFCTCGTAEASTADALRVSIFVWISFLVSTFLDDISSKPFGVWAQKKREQRFW